MLSKPFVELSKPEIHSDPRGWLFEIVTCDTGFEPRQVYVVQCREGYPRGRHYHAVKREVFAVVAGRCKLRVISTQEQNQDYTYVLGPNERYTVAVIPRNVWHEFTAMNGEATVIAVADAWYDPDAEDTYRDGVPETAVRDYAALEEYHDG